MTYDQFINLVMQRSRLGERERAVGAIRATLETLSERLAGGELKDIVSQLPREIAYYFTRSTGPLRLSLQDFHQRVALRAGCDLPEAVFHARVVMSVLEDALSPGEIRDMRAQLPKAYDDLFDRREFLAEHAGVSPQASAPGREQS